MSENEPKIPKETFESMKRFFLKTSIPRIIEEERKEKEKQKQMNGDNRNEK